MSFHALRCNLCETNKTSEAWHGNVQYKLSDTVCHGDMIHTVHICTSICTRSCTEQGSNSDYSKTCRRRPFLLFSFPTPTSFGRRLAPQLRRCSQHPRHPSGEAISAWRRASCAASWVAAWLDFASYRSHWIGQIRISTHKYRPQDGEETKASCRHCNLWFLVLLLWQQPRDSHHLLRRWHPTLSKRHGRTPTLPCALADSCPWMLWRGASLCVWVC